MPISLFIFGLFSLTTPYLNAFSVAKRSQKTELMKSLTKNNLLENNKINFNKEVPDAVADDISDKFNFLVKRKEAEFLYNLLSTEVKERFEKEVKSDEYRWRYSNIRNEFKNIKYVAKVKENKRDYRTTRLVSTSLSADITTYRQLYKFDYRNNSSFVYEQNTFQLQEPGSIIKSEFYLIYNGQKINLFPELKQLFSNAPKHGEQYVNELFITKKVGKYEIKILFDSLSRTTSPDKKEEYIINSQSMIVLIK